MIITDRDGNVIYDCHAGRPTFGALTPEMENDLITLWSLPEPDWVIEVELEDE